MTQILIPTYEQWKDLKNRVGGLGDVPYTDKEWAKLWGDVTYDPEHPTLGGLKEAILAGDYSAFPIGTEFPDTWDGINNPMILVDTKTPAKLVTDNSYHNGVWLLRKWISPTALRYNSTTDTVKYHNSYLCSFMDSTYYNKCSAELRSLIARIKLPVEDDYGTVAEVNCTVFAPTSTQLGNSMNSSLPTWEFFAENAASKRQKTDLEGNIAPWWTASYMFGSYYYVTTGGSITSDTWVFDTRGAVGAVFIPVE